jgi:hypothetical protein
VQSTQGETEEAQPMTLHIAHELSLPIELAGRTQVILAQKGAGKTYTAMREAEQLLDAGQQVVALDPTGVWWGLRSPAAGRGKGFGVIVMGGDHADLPVEPAAGTIVADFLVESRESVILDLSAFESNAAQNRFVTDFAERLYRAKASDRRTVHLMLDEADGFCPQRPMPGEQRMLGAFEAIVRRGRSRGIGITLISQRPAVLNKNVMSQADLLVCLRVVGQHDHKALREWTDLYATPEQRKEFMESLPTLKTGEAWFWSPSWLNIFQRAQVTKRVSYDSSATPDAQAKTEPARTVKVDLEKLSAAIRETAKRAEANDPRKLKARVVELEAKLQRTDADSKKEVPVLSDADRALLTEAKNWMGDGFAKRLEGIARQFNQVLDAALAEVRKVAAVGNRVDASMQNHSHIRITPRAPREAMAREKSVTGSVQSGGMRRMMIALAQRPGLSARQLGVRASLSSSSGTFGTYLAKLRSNGWMEGTRDRMELTIAGREALGGYTPLPTGKALLAHWLGELGQGSGAARMLAALAEAYPRAITKEELGRAAEISHTSGTFGTYISRLRTLELVTGSREISAASEFFD